MKSKRKPTPAGKRRQPDRRKVTRYSFEHIPPMILDNQDTGQMLWPDDCPGVVRSRTKRKPAKPRRQQATNRSGNDAPPVT